MHILYKYASRSRPERFFDGLHNLIDLQADKENYTVYCCLDTDDQSMYTQDHPCDRVLLEQKLFQEKFKHVIFDWGLSRSKIHAINRPVPTSIPFDILVNFSDDMRFQVFGYDHLIREAIRCNGPDVFCHFPDSTAQNMLATMSIMDRAYFDRDGYIYHPAYQSLWADNAAMAVAQLRGRYVYIGTQIFDHFHPAYGHVPWDTLYTHEQAFWAEDELVFLYQKSKNFFLDEIIDINSYYNRTSGAI